MTDDQTGSEPPTGSNTRRAPTESITRRAPAESLTRRGVIALASSGLVGTLAGCAGDDGAGTDEPGEAGTEGSTRSPTDSPTATRTASPTRSPTESPTPTRSVEELIAVYGCPDISAGGDFDIVVAADGSGDYESVQAAIDAIEPGDFGGTRVFVASGRYREKLRLPPNLTDVTFVGAGPEETVLTYDDHADMESEHGGEIGTSGSSSFFADGLDFTATDVTFENAADPVAQAVAVRTTGDRAMYVNCRFVGNQDTLYARGAGSRQYYRDCHVEGDVDFIFGGATAYFQNCDVLVTDEGYVTAASTAEAQPYGYVFNDCEVRSDGGDYDAYLGRPWERYAQTVFMNSYLGDVIRPEGWDPWHEADHPDKTETVFYAEYDNEGPGYAPDQRVEWSHQLSEEAAEPYADLEEVFGGWNPEACL